MRAYSYYHKYFLSFFLQAGYNYSVLSLIPAVSSIKIFFSIFDTGRLSNLKEKSFFFFLLKSVSLGVGRWKCRASKGLKTPHYLFSTTVRTLDCFYERFIFFSYAYYCAEAIKTMRFSNDTLTVSLPGFRFFEYEFFRVTDRFVENPFEFTITSRFQFLLKPRLASNIYAQRALLRGLNLPLKNFEKGG